MSISIHFTPCTHCYSFGRDGRLLRIVFLRSISPPWRFSTQAEARWPQSTIINILPRCIIHISSFAFQKKTACLKLSCETTSNSRECISSPRAYGGFWGFFWFASSTPIIYERFEDDALQSSWLMKLFHGGLQIALPTISGLNLIAIDLSIFSSQFH